jgi:hypothetical protein
MHVQLIYGEVAATVQHLTPTARVPRVFVSAPELPFLAEASAGWRISS